MRIAVPRTAWSARPVEAGTTRVSGSARATRPTRTARSRTTGTTRATGRSTGPARTVFAGATRTTGTTWSTRARATGAAGTAGIIWPGRRVDTARSRSAMASRACGSGVGHTGTHAQRCRAEGAGQRARRNQLLEFHISPHSFISGFVEC
ncbi:hypothetical protein AWC29_13245 [Mycobacterium triplex]|uniref:Uncharacterized protein n=1 Tax=Mycobacterium triplex TaxID=47839 RepID=A0ABX3W7S2_9MYCO|nr:hypothetical protein AWC29_13245 [Mycobacterium triplex]